MATFFRSRCHARRRYAPALRAVPIVEAIFGDGSAAATTKRLSEDISDRGRTVGV